jgi:AcrR family transcriptional regulator
MPKGIPLTEDEVERRRREIFHSAVALILKQGFHATSMKAIAEAAGVGKSTLYDYFPTKDHVLLFVFAEELDALQDQAKGIAARDLPAQEKLTLLLAGQLEFLLKNRNFFMEISMQAMHLSQAGQKRIMKKRYAYQDLLRAVLDQGVGEGIFRPVNTRLAARTLLSIIEMLVYTTRPTGTPAEMLADAMDMFMNGINSTDRARGASALRGNPL